MLRLRRVTPPPQEVVQVDHSVQEPRRQLAGHAARLHARVSEECAHGLPPSMASMVPRVRLCEPVPHDLVQVDQAAHLPSVQSVGQLAALQARVSAECGHAVPPHAGATFWRVRFCEPVPHDLVHVDHAPKLAMPQLAGQHCELQVRVSAECGHALPPYFGAASLRVRDWTPPPQVLVHELQLVKVYTTQASGHA